MVIQSCRVLIIVLLFISSRGQGQQIYYDKISPDNQIFIDHYLDKFFIADHMDLMKTEMLALREMYNKKYSSIGFFLYPAFRSLLKERLANLVLWSLNDLKKRCAAIPNQPDNLIEMHQAVIYQKEILQMKVWYEKSGEDKWSNSHMPLNDIVNQAVENSFYRYTENPTSMKELAEHLAYIVLELHELFSRKIIMLGFMFRFDDEISDYDINGNDFLMFPYDMESPWHADKRALKVQKKLASYFEKDIEPEMTIEELAIAITTIGKDRGKEKSERMSKKSKKFVPVVNNNEGNKLIISMSLSAIFLFKLYPALKGYLYPADHQPFDEPAGDVEYQEPGGNNQQQQQQQRQQRQQRQQPRENNRATHVIGQNNGGVSESNVDIGVMVTPDVSATFQRAAQENLLQPDSDQTRQQGAPQLQLTREEFVKINLRREREANGKNNKPRRRKNNPYDY